MASDPQPPAKHHYLPKWYLDRWAIDGEVTAFRRVGPKRELYSSQKSPAAIGYERNLYTIPDKEPSLAARIETEFLQAIDNRGAQAVAMAENNLAAGPHDKAGLVQFLLSLMHRTPDRIDHLETRLTRMLSDKPEFADADPAIFRHAALNVFADLVQSEVVLNRLSELRTFVVTLHESGRDLVTGDRPLVVSGRLDHKDAFVILPIGPRRMLMLAENENLVQRLAGREAKVLSGAMNDAVVVQATNLVIARNENPRRFVDNRLGVESARRGRPLNPETGLVHWAM
ncbi:MAG: DUF4238 domain-containing protein [Pseudomonadota bacterium]